MRIYIFLFLAELGTKTNDYIHDVQLPTFHVIRQTFLTSYSSLYTSQPHQAHTCYSHAQTHTKDCIILAQCWIISFLKDYYGIYLVKWINTEVFFNCNVNIFTVSNTILYSLRIELETYFFFNIPYLTILNTLEVSENTFSHQNITFYAFFSIRPPTRGSFYVKILFMITWLIMELETYFFF